MCVMPRQTEDSSVDGGRVDLERILVKEVGQCGWYQIRVVALCGLVSVMVGLSAIDYVFTFVMVNTRCVIPECENTTRSDYDFAPPWILNALPPSHDSFDNCRRYRTTVANSTDSADSCPSDIFDRNSTVPCEDYVYEDKNSAIYEFNMACDDWRRHFLGSANLLGMMICLPLAGFVSDRWGRRIAISVSILNHSVFGCLQYFSNSYISYLLITLIKCITGACTFTTAYILALEYTGPEYRVVMGATTSACLALGGALEGLLASTRPYWRNLLLLTNAPLFIFVSYFWIMPESFRWLLSKGRFEEAEKILKKAAKANGNVLSQKTLESFSGKRVSEMNQTVSQTDSEIWLVSLVFKHRPIFFRCILTPVWWITVLFIFYGLTLSSVGIVGNKYLNFSAVCAIEIPGYLTAALLLNRIGRKPLLIAGFWICSACQIAYILMPNGHYWLSLSVYLIGKLTISAVMTSLYVFTGELYPTRYRSTLLGYSSMIGRLGAILGPLTPALSDAIWQPLPFVLFAGMAFLCGALVTLAPETLGCALPDSMQDAEDLGKDRPSIMQLLRRLLFKKKTYTLR